MERVSAWRTVWRATVKTPCCDGAHYQDFGSEEEAAAYGLGPESAGLVSLEPLRVMEPEEVRRRWRAWWLLTGASCPLPPESDLLLTAAAKELPPERWAEIDPSRGSWPRTRERLRAIRSDRYNEMLRLRWQATRDTP